MNRSMILSAFQLSIASSQTLSNIVLKTVIVLFCSGFCGFGIWTEGIENMLEKGILAEKEDGCVRIHLGQIWELTSMSGGLEG